MCKENEMDPEQEYSRKEGLIFTNKQNMILHTETRTPKLQKKKTCPQKSKVI